MKKVGNYIVNHSLLIIIISLLLLIPAVFGFIKTRINYDILVYLPDDVETVKGEKILTEDFGIGSYAFIIVDNMSNSDILKLENKLRKVDGVNEVISEADILGTTIDIEMLPDNIKNKIYKDKSTYIVATISDSASSDTAINAVKGIRDVVGDVNSVSSMTAMVLDTMEISSEEVLVYVIVAVVLCLIILFVTTDSYLIPFLLLANIGIAILYNMGTNIFLGEISYITKAISAVLQLGVTTDFSIFLYHKYEQYKEKNKDNKKAMEHALSDTFKSVLGSSLTTIAGFLALCTMRLTLGKDIGLVMAKGVVWGVLSVLTLFPALLLFFDKAIDKTKHRSLFPQFRRLQKFAATKYILIGVVFLILMIPAYIGNKNYEVYYKLDESLPSDLGFNVSNKRMKEKFNINSPYMILVNSNLKSSEIDNMVNDIEKIKGIDFVLSAPNLEEYGIELNEDLNKILNNKKYKIVLINSDYEMASNKLNNQIRKVEKIVKSYDKKSIIAGEGPLMKDLVTIADHDFKMVNYTSIIVIFIIMMLVLKSVSLPVILVFTIEFAIFSNMACAYFMGTKLPFIASIVVGTIQLGATIDYAILMSTKYLDIRTKESDKHKAIKKTLSLTVPSIIVSALCFFSATIGVGLYTKIDMIGSICTLLSRGSIISMLVVVLILPSLLVIFDKIIMKTTKIKEAKK